MNIANMINDALVFVFNFFKSDTTNGDRLTLTRCCNEGGFPRDNSVANCFEVVRTKMSSEKTWNGRVYSIRKSDEILVTVSQKVSDRILACSAKLHTKS